MIKHFLSDFLFFHFRNSLIWKCLLLALPEPSAEPGGGLSVLAGPSARGSVQVAGQQGGSTPKQAGRWHPLLRAPSRLGGGCSAAISQSNRIHGTPLCERILSACHLSTLKRWLTASDGQVTGLWTAYSFKPANRGAEGRRGPRLCGALVRPSAQSAPPGEGP